MKISTKQIDIEIADEHFTDENLERLKALLEAVVTFSNQTQQGMDYELLSDDEDLDDEEEDPDRPR